MCANTEKADLRAEMPRITSHFEKGFRAGTKQEIVEDFFVVQHQRGQVARQGEDHV